MTQKKTCPFCAEEINVEAIKCKHCGSMLTISVAKDKRQVNKELRRLHRLLFWTIGIVGLVLLILFWRSYINRNF